MEQKPSGEESMTKTLEKSNKSKDVTKPEKEAVCSKVSNIGSECMSTMIVPVWVSSKSSPRDDYLLYALLDTQSDTTFILEETADILDPNSETANLRLSIMSARDNLIRYQKLRGLQVRGYDSDMFIDLPITYSRNFIPTDRSHIPTPTFAKKWPHLRRIAHLMHPMQDCEVGLLIGYNCPLALAPRSYITGEGNQPFAIQTDLGWSTVGGTDPYEDGDAIETTHIVVVKEIQEQLRPRTEQEAHRQEVRFVAKTTVKEVMDIPPTEITRILESDFTYGSKGDKHMSQEDMLFLEKIGNGTHQQEDEPTACHCHSGHGLPNNGNVALRRFSHLRRRFKSDENYFRDYKTFMDELTELMATRRNPAEELNGVPAWYVPHHGVYHPKKPDKIRVVFDCSAYCQGTSLNDHILQGPDLTNGLIGVLVRFRQERIALMCDVEKMFHQFRVDEKDRNYIRFLDEKGLQNECPFVRSHFLTWMCQL